MQIQFKSITIVIGKSEKKITLNILIANILSIIAHLGI